MGRRLATCGESFSICSAGKYNPDLATDPALHAACEACLPGKFNVDTGKDAERHDDVGDCYSCDVGTFSNDENGATSCQACPTGLISGSGASSCSTCPVGYKCTDGVVDSPCPAGKYSDGTTSECTECESKYKCPGGTDKVRIDNKRSSKTTMRLTPTHTPRRSPVPPEASPPCPLSPLVRAVRLARSSPTRRRMPALPAPRDTFVPPPPSPHSPAYQARPSNQTPLRHHASPARTVPLEK